MLINYIKFLYSYYKSGSTFSIDKYILFIKLSKCNITNFLSVISPLWIHIWTREWHVLQLYFSNTLVIWNRSIYHVVFALHSSAGQQISDLSVKTPDLLFVNHVEIFSEEAVNRCRCARKRNLLPKTTPWKIVFFILNKRNNSLVE